MLSSEHRNTLCTIVWHPLVFAVLITVITQFVIELITTSMRDKPELFLA